MTIPNITALRNLNILMVDDSPLNTTLTSMLFSQNGLKLQVAENGSIAVERVKAEHFDIILMDIEMPVMNGYEATTMIRQELNNNTPIIAMTAHTSSDEKGKFIECGMNGHITKPVDEDLLFAMIHELTNKLTGTEVPKPEAAGEKICNLQYLTTATRGNEKMLRNIIDVFLEETPVELAALQDAINT